MKRIFLTLLSLTTLPLAARDIDPAPITLTEIDGHTWLIDPGGQPFFAHGVTHVGSKHQGVTAADIGEACKELGFNAYGYGCPPTLKEDLPYLEGKNIIPTSTYRTDGSFTYVDIFDPEVQANLEAQIKMMCFSNRKNPNLIGYCWTDLSAWPLENSTKQNWVNFIRELPDSTPGKRAYQQFLETREGDDPGQRDLTFLRLIAREYFRVLGEANRKYDPDHLIFGDRFGFDTAVPEVIEEMLPYVDAIAIQPPFQSGFPKAEYERIHKLTGKPIILCDFAIRFKDGDKAIRGWKPEESSRAAGESYAAYLREAMATPYIIGAFWCNPIDSKPGFEKAGIKQGLFDTGLTPRDDLNAAIRELNQYRDEITPEIGDAQP
jgi:hypothetical protein